MKAYLVLGGVENQGLKVLCLSNPFNLVLIHSLTVTPIFAWEDDHQHLFYDMDQIWLKLELWTLTWGVKNGSSKGQLQNITKSKYPKISSKE